MGVLPFHCHQLLVYAGLFDCWGCLCIVVGFLPYSVKHLEITLYLAPPSDQVWVRSNPRW